MEKNLISEKNTIPMTSSLTLSSGEISGKMSQSSGEISGSMTYSQEGSISSPEGYVWKEIERWPIDIGRKHYKAISVNDLVIETVQKGDR